MSPFSHFKASNCQKHCHFEPFSGISNFLGVFKFSNFSNWLETYSHLSIPMVRRNIKCFNSSQKQWTVFLYACQRHNLPGFSFFATPKVNIIYVKYSLGQTTEIQVLKCSENSPSIVKILKLWRASGTKHIWIKFHLVAVKMIRLPFWLWVPRAPGRAARSPSAPVSPSRPAIATRASPRRVRSTRWPPGTVLYRVVLNSSN